MEQDDEPSSLPPALSLPPSNKQGETEACGMDVKVFLAVCGDSGKLFACEEVFEACLGDARDVQFGFLTIFGEEEEEKALFARIP